MLRSCLMTRKELVEIIKKAPITKDKYYYFPRFRALVLLPGNIKDDGYYYDRSLFRDKMCFDETDLKMFTARKRAIVDADLRRFIDNKLKEVLKGIEFLQLKDQVPGTDYTLEELIDNTIYLVKHKYS